MALASYQKISRVLQGQPFGTGADGALTISGNTTQSPVDESCSGASGNTTLTCGSTSLTNGDIVLLHQTRGTGVGQWEINRVASGGGTVNIVLQTAKQFTYTDSGNSQAQAIKIPQYSSITVNNGVTWTGKAWTGDVGGILLFACNGTTTVTGSITASGKGYLGGDAVTSQFVSATGKQGEGHTAIGDTQSTSANGSGGGGGSRDTIGAGGSGAGGGGGGHSASGTTGTQGDSPSCPGGTGGGTSGSAELTTCTFGGAGGSGGTDDPGGTSGAGGVGGGLILGIAKIISITGTLVTGGTNGGNSATFNGGGGGGAGGSGLFMSQIATLGGNRITAPAGSGGTGGNAGGAGSVGRIALHYSGSYTGTTTPTISATLDPTLIESSGAFIFNLI